MTLRFKASSATDSITIEEATGRSWSIAGVVPFTMKPLSGDLDGLQATPTRTPPPAADGFTPRDGTAAASQIVSGALLITNLVVTEEGANNGTVSFTVKNISKQVVNLLPQVMVSEDIGTSRRSGMWGGEQGPGLICHTLGPNQSERITIEGGTSDGGFPINWTSAVVTNGPQGAETKPPAP